MPTLRSGSILGSAAVLAAMIVVSGCHGGQHPDDRMAVYNALDKNDLRSLTVSQDRGIGTITLSGVVGSMERRQQAEQIAKQAAPEYQIVDRIQIQSTGLQDDIDSAKQKAQLDSVIEDKFKAKISDEPSLKTEKIHSSVYHGTLTLDGSVKNWKERKEAEDLANQIPDVQHVVNHLQIRSGKASSDNS